MPKTERHLWNAAKSREFNIGMQAGTQPRSSEFALAAETVKAACDLGARIVFTVYAPEEPKKPVGKRRAHPKKAVVSVQGD